MPALAKTLLHSCFDINSSFLILVSPLLRHLHLPPAPRCRGLLTPCHSDGGFCFAICHLAPSLPGGGGSPRRLDLLRHFHLPIRHQIGDQILHILISQCCPPRPKVPGSPDPVPFRRWILLRELPSSSQPPRRGRETPSPWLISAFPPARSTSDRRSNSSQSHLPVLPPAPRCRGLLTPCHSDGEFCFASCHLAHSLPDGVGRPRRLGLLRHFHLPVRHQIGDQILHILIVQCCPPRPKVPGSPDPVPLRR